MKQYCRYCANFFTGNGDWCEEYGKDISESSAKSPNRCKKFSFLEIDAYDVTKKYKPREKKVDCMAGQPTLFDF